MRASNTFFFNYTPTTEIYTLSLHDALPISHDPERVVVEAEPHVQPVLLDALPVLGIAPARSEEHTSELQSQFHLVCRLLLEKKKRTNTRIRNCQLQDHQLGCAFSQPTSVLD